MKFWTVLIDGCPRLDITAATESEVSHRAAKVLGGREWNFYYNEGRAKPIQVKLEVMV